jgi:hypothetical protein
MRLLRREDRPPRNDMAEQLPYFITLQLARSLGFYNGIIILPAKNEFSAADFRGEALTKEPRRRKRLFQT